MHPRIPDIPEACQIVFLAEGAANIVYRVQPPSEIPIEPSILEEYGDRTPPPTEIELDYEDEIFLGVFDNKLLRLRKDLPTTLPVHLAQEQWEKWVRPLFDNDQIVQQQLVKLQPGNVIRNLNKELSSTENTTRPRPPKRRGVYLADDAYGLLVTDMTPTSSASSLVVEFKPKWLLQSPSAPTNSRRCRQCAITARKNHRLPHTRSSGTPLPDFCPLDLVSNSPNDVQYSASQILPPDSKPSDINRFTEWLQRTPLLHHLHTKQSELDTLGPLHADPNDINYRLAMTLRDCTVFVRFPSNQEDDDKQGSIEARIGDLDVKSVDKGATWRRVEQELISEGWYEGIEQGSGATGVKRNNCRLGRGRG